VNASDEKGRTPLHMVGMCGGSISVAEVLVKKGANVTAVDSNGLTCWDLGYTFKNVEFAAWLEEQIFARDGRREKGSVRKKGRQGKK
jgi:ankyrin repeat protein